MQEEINTSNKFILSDLTKSKANILKLVLITIVALTVIFICTTDLYNTFASSRPQVVKEFLENFDQISSVAEKLNSMFETNKYLTEESTLSRLEDDLSESNKKLEDLDDKEIESSIDALLDYSKNLNSIITKTIELAEDQSTPMASSEFKKIESAIDDANDQVEVLEDAIRSEMRLDVDLDKLDVSKLYITTPKELTTSTKTSSSQSEEKKSESNSQQTDSQSQNNTQQQPQTEGNNSQSNGNQSNSNPSGGTQSGGNQTDQSQGQTQQQTPATGQAQQEQSQPVTITTTVTTYTTYITEETTTYVEEIVEEVEEVEEVQENVEVIEEVQEPQVEETVEVQTQELQYVPTSVNGNIATGNLIYNTRTHKLHKYPGTQCIGVRNMYDINKQILEGPLNLDEYDLCKICF